MYVRDEKFRGGPSDRPEGAIELDLVAPRPFEGVLALAKSHMESRLCGLIRNDCNVLRCRNHPVGWKGRPNRIPEANRALEHDPGTGGVGLCQCDEFRCGRLAKQSGLPTELNNVGISRHVIMCGSLSRTTDRVRKIERRSAGDELVVVVELAWNVLQLTH